jgi:hypothetical protein
LPHGTAQINATFAPLSGKSRNSHYDLKISSALMSFDASRSVQTEMNSAPQVGQRIVKSALAQVP